MLVATGAADASTSVSKRYVHAFDGQPFYLDAHLDLGLLCDRAGLGYGIGGVCFDLPQGASSVFVNGNGLMFGKPAAVLWWVDPTNAHVRSDTSCLFDDHDVPEGASRLVVIAFRPGEWNGCGEASGAFGIGYPGPTGQGTITATFW